MHFILYLLSSLFMEEGKIESSVNEVSNLLNPRPQGFEVLHFPATMSPSSSLLLHSPENTAPTLHTCILD